METVREQLIKLLQSESAHDNFNTVVSKFPKNLINHKIPGVTYTPWHLIEHIRIAQKDILDYIIGTDYKELEWPKEYWPKPEKRATVTDWETTVKRYNRDLAELIKIVENNKNLSTISSKILLVADHTAYHVGELSIVKSILRSSEE